MRLHHLEDNPYRQFVKDGKYGVAALPKGKVDGNTLYNGGFVAWAKTKDTQKCYRLIKHVCGPEGIAAIMKISANLPANKSLDWVGLNMAKPGFAADKAQMEAVFKNVQTGKLPFDRNDPRWDDTEIQEMLGTALDNVLNQGQKPDDVIPEAVKKINDRMRELATKS